MPFGNQTITFVSRTASGTPDELGMQTLTEDEVDVPGCRHRPLTFAETAEAQIDVATQPWRSTIPVGEFSADLRDAVLEIQPGDQIRVDDVTYQIIGGIRHHVDMDGTPFKATLISQRQVG